MHTAESNRPNFVIEYLGEIKTEFENILLCLSVSQMGSKSWKKYRSKILWHTPFNNHCDSVHTTQSTTTSTPCPHSQWLRRHGVNIANKYPDIMSASVASDFADNSG